MNRTFLLLLLLLTANLLRSQTVSPPEPPPILPAASASPSPAVTPGPGGGPEGGGGQDTVVDEIERLLRERESAQAAAAARLPPDQPRTHRFTNQPLSRVLRILAEQAEINYIEPNFTSEERISVTLNNLTPLQAFYEIAESRGFQVVSDGRKYTLRRSDVESPSFYLTRRYPIRNQSAEFLLQPIANLLGIKVAPATDQFPAYPKPANNNLTPDAFSPGSGATGTGSDQSRPRYQPGVPFDAPLSTGGFARDGQSAIFIERSSNSLVVRTTFEQQEAVAAEISRLDRREQQILIKTYVVEVTDSNGIGGGIDWSQTLGLSPDQGAKFSLTGNVGTPSGQTISGRLNPGAFFTNGLILNLSDVQIVLRALKQRGRVKSSNSPMTVAKSGMPVTIRSDTKQTIFLQTPGTNNYGPSTTPYTFTTGLTIDVVARILEGGLIDLNLNPTLSSAIGTSDAQPGTTTQVPVISTRSTTANITVKSGQAAVIGGILQDTANFNANGIPGLSRIPIVGYLFKSHIRSNQRTNLIVIVCPTIVPANLRRQDRVGESERKILTDAYDLPGEPPPLLQGAADKQLPAER
jgi:type II secretory pathway component GspD/PulD (secretin)